MTLDIVQVARVTPAADSDSVFNSLTIPLSFFDLPWLLFSPVTHVFFYRLNEATRAHFLSFILPKLKLSLSLVLRNYLPLTGRITWDPNEPKPSIVVSQNDAVSVTIPETNADFSHISGYGQRPVSELHNLLPKLPVSDVSASTFALQITLFPNHGFSIGFAAHHAVFDGQTASMFIKAWAHICKHQLENENIISLPKNLTPSYDRSLIKDLIGIDEKVMELLRSFNGDKNNTSRSLLPPFPARKLGDDVVFSTLVLSREDIERFRERVKSQDRDLHLSTFVIAYAYVWTCFVKARGGSEEGSVGLAFLGNLRERLDPPLPATYFGNCMFPTGSYNRMVAEFSGDKGFVTAVKILSELIKGLSSKKIETIAEEFSDCFNQQRGTQLGSVAGSTRMGVYGWDFGWGKPVKVEIVSIDQVEAFSMAERRDESGGVEIGMCLKKTEMDMESILY